MTHFLALFLLLAALLTRSPCASLKDFETPFFSGAEPKRDAPFGQPFPGHIAFERLERSAAAVIDFHSKPPPLAGEHIAEDKLTFNNTPDLLTSTAAPIELNNTSINGSHGTVGFAVTTEATSASPSLIIIVSQSIPPELQKQNETTASPEEDYYYTDYETETTSYDEATTMSNYVTGDNGTMEMSTGDKLESSQVAQSFVALNTTRTIGRALSTHSDLDVAWEARSTKVASTFVNDQMTVEGPNNQELATGVIVAVTLSVLFLLIAAGGSGFWWYRRRYTNRPEALNDRYAASETGHSAGDDIFRVGYVHHPELPKDSSEEMYSLDNDSFLTSLEAMTIPNYWTESIKHTKL